MILTVITVAALAGALVTGYFAYKYKSEANDAVDKYDDLKAKYDATKQFADDSAKHILTLEDKVLSMSDTVLKNASVISSLKAEVARSKEKAAHKPAPVRDEKRSPKKK